MLCVGVALGLESVVFMMGVLLSLRCRGCGVAVMIELGGVDRGFNWF